MQPVRFLIILLISLAILPGCRSGVSAVVKTGGSVTAPDATPETDAETTDKTETDDDESLSDLPELEIELPRRRVTIRGGLNLRSQPHLNSTVIRVLAYNEEVQLLTTSFQKEYLDRNPGRWVLVRSGEEEGWVFDAFLSTVATPGALADVDEDDREDALEVAREFYLLEIDAGLFSSDDDGRRLLGRIRKPGSSDKISVTTLKRICGEGRSSRNLHYHPDGVDFYLEYFRCEVDPGDQVQNSCINCNITTYRCRLPDSELDEAPLYQEDIECQPVSDKFCQEDCWPE